MSVVQDLRTRAKHRGLTPWQLIQKIGRLEREADDHTCQMVAMATEIDELRADRNRLQDDFDRAAIDYSGALQDRDEWRDKALALQARFGPQLAAEANANRVTVPPMVRDTSAIEDQATGPIYVQPLRDAVNAGPIGPVMDPGHVASREVVS